MVYVPKPRIPQRVLGEALGFATFIFISRVVTATTGGSTAFATNLLWCAIGDGVGYAIAIFMFPFAIMDLTLLICFLFHDLIMWALGRQGFNVVDAVLYVVFALVQFIMGMIAYLLIWAFVPSSASNLGIPLVPAGVTEERAIFSEIIQASFWVMGFFIISEIIGMVFKEARSPAQKDAVTGKFIRGKYNHTMYLIAAVFRAIMLGGIRTGISLGGIPINGGLYNILGYIDGAIVSWTWPTNWYVASLGPLGGMFGFVVYLIVIILPSIPLYRLAFGEDEAKLKQMEQAIKQRTSLKPIFGKQQQQQQQVPHPSTYYHESNMYHDGRPIMMGAPLSTTASRQRYNHQIAEANNSMNFM